MNHFLKLHHFDRSLIETKKKSKNKVSSLAMELPGPTSTEANLPPEQGFSVPGRNLFNKWYVFTNICNSIKRAHVGWLLWAESFLSEFLRWVGVGDGGGGKSKKTTRQMTTCWSFPLLFWLSAGGWGWDCQVVVWYYGWNYTISFDTCVVLPVALSCKFGFPGEEFVRDEAVLVRKIKIVWAFP